MTLPVGPLDADGALIIYDGDCPLCRNFVRGARLAAAAGGLTVVSTRDDHPEVARALAAGFNLDDGMLVRLAGQDYFADEAAHLVALLSTPSGLFNRVLFALLRSPARARVLYPWLRAGRNALLWLLGRR